MAITERVLKLIIGGENKEALKTLAGVGTAVAAVAAAIAVMKKAYDFAEEGAQNIRLKESGQALASSMGQSMDSIVRSIKQASGDTVTEMDAMAVANKAMMLGVATTPREFDKLTTASIALGRAMGRTATESIDDVTIGVGRMSKKILDNLGIVYDANTEYAKYAEKIGKAGEALTDAEKKQALMNLVLNAATPLLDENGNLVDDMASQYEKAETAWEDWIAGVKEGINDVVVPSISIGNQRRETIKSIEKAQEDGLITEKQANKMKREANLTTSGLTRVTEELRVILLHYGNDLTVLNPLIGVYSTGLEDVWTWSEKVALVTDDMSKSQLEAAAMEALIAGDFQYANYLMGLAGHVGRLEQHYKSLITTMGQYAAAQIAMPDEHRYATGGNNFSTVPLITSSGGGSSSGGRNEYITGVDGQRWHVTDAGWEKLATGGSFTVGGSGGSDSQPVNMMLTPGEQVSVNGGTNDMAELFAQNERSNRRLITAIKDIVERV